MNIKGDIASCRLCFSSNGELIHIFKPSNLSENNIAETLEQHFPYEVSFQR